MKVKSSTLNKQFNRTEFNGQHYYMEDFGTEPLQNVRHEGYIKCRLMHTAIDKVGGSIIVPDLILLDTGSLVFIQPLAFLPNMIVRTEDETICSIQIDISGGQSIRVEFSNRQKLRSLKDGSELYKCTMTGPRDLENYYTGMAAFKEDYRLFLQLYHYTSHESAALINKSNWLKDSAWNIAGNLQLENVGYVYFTCLDEIKYEGDLQQIAMSSVGKLKARTDHTNRVLTLYITKKDIRKLRCQLAYQIEASAIAPNHLYRHTNHLGAVWYQICSPFIYRIGVQPPEEGIRYQNSEITSLGTKIFDYIIAGDCSTIDGLRAPYDEENTRYIYKLERVDENTNILDFWMDNSNTDHFSGKTIEMQQFKKT